MDSPSHDFLVFIGRFQPFHKGHLKVVLEALEISTQVILIAGSARQPRTARNPWTADEREAMVKASIAECEKGRVHFAALGDRRYNDDRWLSDVQAIVDRQVKACKPCGDQPPRIGLIEGSNAPERPGLHCFPQWDAVTVEAVEGINAAEIRTRLLEDGHLDAKAERQLPEGVASQLMSILETPGFKALLEEHAFIQEYRKAWETAPYPPTFVTVDAVVVQCGHILLVQRKDPPGKDLLALPGGFLDPDETILEACLRELREETRLNFAADVLHGCIRSRRVFDDPYRSARGRTITHAFHIELPADHLLPRVEGGDDARMASWVPLADLDSQHFFEDHYHIICSMLRI